MYRVILVYLILYFCGFRIGKKLFKKFILINYGYNSLWIFFLMMFLFKIEVVDKEIIGN